MQDVLPFRRREAGVLSYATELERRIFFSAGAALAVLVVLYIYFVVASIAHVAARQELLSKISAAQAEVGTLETAYFKKTAGITESYAEELGFVTPSKNVFVERDAALTLQNAP